MRSTQATWRVSVKKRAVLWVRAIRCCSSLCSDITLVLAPSSLVPCPLPRVPCPLRSVRVRQHAHRLAIEEECGAADDHLFAKSDAAFDGDGIADHFAELDPPHARRL